MNKSCENCNRIPAASGSCDHGVWYFKTYPICVICGEPVKLGGLSFGYGSEFDTGSVCANCCHKYIDPAVKGAREQIAAQDSPAAQKIVVQGAAHIPSSTGSLP